MSSMDICSEGYSAPIKTLQALPTYQGSAGRHKCAVCAYQQGIIDSVAGERENAKLESCEHGNSVPLSMIQSLHDYQGKNARHRCAICAYAIGKAIGGGYRDEISIDRWVLVKEESPGAQTKPPVKKRRAVKVDHIARDVKSHNLGLAGEKMVLRLEKETLIKHGKPELAQKVEHVSVEQGDGLGYDILSFTSKGEEKFIEVKTTVGNKNTPFEISSNEIEFSEEKGENYYLYRVYNFGVGKETANYYAIRGKVSDNFELVPTRYRAYKK